MKFGLRYDSFMPNHQCTAAAAPIAWDWMKRMRSIVHASRNTHTRWRNSISYIEALTVSGWHWAPCVYRQFHASMRAYTKNRRIANKIGNRFYGHRKLKSGILVIDASIIGRLACAQQHTHCAQLQIVQRTCARNDDDNDNKPCCECSFEKGNLVNAFAWCIYHIHSPYFFPPLDFGFGVSFILAL